MTSIFNRFRILDVQYDQSMAASPEVFVAVFHHQTLAPALRRMMFEIDKLAKQNAGQVSMINIIRPNAPMPDEAARRAMTEVFQYLVKRAHTESAVVFEGNSIRASVIRSVVTGFSLVARATLPIKVFGSLKEALAWQEPYLFGTAESNAVQIGAILDEIEARRRALPAFKAHKQGVA